MADRSDLVRVTIVSAFVAVAVWALMTLITTTMRAIELLNSPPL